MKERNTWRRRREILGGEGEKYLEEKEVKIHSQQEKGGNFKTSEGTQFGVQRHISMNILVIYFAICCCTYTNVYRYMLIYVTVQVNIYICVEVNAHYVCVQLQVFKSQKTMISVSHFSLKVCSPVLIILLFFKHRRIYRKDCAPSKEKK